MSVALAAEHFLVNGSTGDPLLFVDYPDTNDAILFDAGDNAPLPLDRLADLTAVFITHHHVDHFIGLDRIVRANIDADKVLSIYGPPGTIQKVYDRVRSYEYQFFPFQKIVLDLIDIGDSTLTKARLECTRKFPPPEPRTEPRTGRTIFENSRCSVESVPVDHTVTCLAYALVERPGWQLKREALTAARLRPGAWSQEAARLLAAGAKMSTPVTVRQEEVTLKSVASQYFQRTTGGRIGYVTDTCWTPAVQPAVLELCRGANILYCDSYYAVAQRSAADKHRHMTTVDAAELATRAKVGELVLMHFGGRYQSRYETLVTEAQAKFGNVSARIP